MEEFQAPGRASTLARGVPASRHSPAKICKDLVLASTTLPLPTLSPATSHLTLLLLNSLRALEWGKGVSPAEDCGVGGLGVKGAWFRPETQRTPPGRGRGTRSPCKAHASARKGIAARAKTPSSQGAAVHKP